MHHLPAYDLVPGYIKKLRGLNHEISNCIDSFQQMHYAVDTYEGLTRIRQISSDFSDINYELDKLTRKCLRVLAKNSLTNLFTKQIGELEK